MTQRELPSLGKRNMVKISLNEDLYSQDSVSQAIKDFSEICEGSFEAKGGRIEIILKSKAEVKNLEQEFCNYVLGLEKDDK